ncbi:hypothetical protein AAG570_006474 [Ranatra chinensis]|uniref:TLC domain-containing protein n=1 Tax=Ranatra chinensis TaxID=642074 RepID=A0ABD0YU32_9HEMI
MYSGLILKYKFEAEFTSRLVAAIHAVLAVVLSFICILQGPDPLVTPGEENTLMQIATMVVSLGYFIYDLWWCVVHQTEPVIILVHHAASILAIFMILIYGSSGSEAVGGLASLEFTNPLLQARWFLRMYGYGEAPLHTLVEVLFIVSFLFFRLGYGSKLLYSVLSHDNVVFPVKLFTVLLYVISIMFIYYIGQFIFRKYVLRSRSHCSDYMCEPDCECRRQQDKSSAE